MSRRELEEQWQPLAMRLHEALEAAAQADGDAVGWVFEDQRVTFAEMLAGARDVAGQLGSLGIRQGDRVAIWLGNELTWAHALYGCSMIGAQLAGLNTRSKAEEVRHALADCGAKALIFRPKLLNIDFVAILREIDPDFTLAAATEAVDGPLVVGVEGARFGAQAALDSLDDGFVPPADRPPPDREALLIQYTSGTSAAPKGALLHHVHILNFGHWVTARLGVGRGDAMLNTQPMYHIGGSVGCLPVPTTLGCVMVIPEFYHPERVLELIQRERCVARTGMSTMYVREMQLADFRRYDLSSLRAGWTIGPPALLDKIRAEFPMEGLVQLYGSSEGGATSGDVDDPWDVRRISCGRPLPRTHISIVEPETGTELETGQTGEIRFAGWARCLGYVGHASEATFDSRGRFLTGDLGHFDPAGHLIFDGRLKELIKPGGENVSALEVEAFLGTHPDVAQVAVFGVPDDDLGEVVMAVIEPVEGRTLEADDILGFCQGRIARFRVPRHIRFVNDWPMTGSGKILKRILRERYVAELEKMSAAG